MIVPKMILFDNGSTLTCEPDIDPLRAMRAVMPHITKNPMGLSAEELVAAELIPEVEEPETTEETKRALSD